MVKTRIFLSYVPIAWFILFALFYLRAYIFLQYVPSYNNPDPKSLGFTMHHFIVFWGIWGVLISPLFWLPLTILSVIKKKYSMMEIIQYILLFVCFILFFKLDFWGLANWFTD